ncbi:unnamed protein product [Schistosoma margrebowiei]|uniref:Reverse transcriptase/retrotransposon-derived protein RNase H-like domain-containing protein n=1 Tax=Schistosoma margrebowiei TaxID=48269 RepID=A0A183MD57_9TREM|nr:unnamed protein product [Schistosoma margrebowiei]
MTSNSFKWGEEQESCLRSLLKFLQSDAVLRTCSPSVHSVLITDASPVGIGAVLEQEARSLAAMVQRWSIALSEYDYTVQHRSAKQIQHVDYISRQSLQDRPVDTSDRLNARHSVTKETPSKLLKGRIVRSNMRCLESAEVTYYRGNDLRPSTGIVLKNVGKPMVQILDINDLSTHNRHVDQIQFQKPGESIPISVVNFNANEHILDNTESLSNTLSDRHRINLRKRRTTDYKHLDSNLSCGGCGV